MANCHTVFTDFNSIIRLNESKRKSLKKSRTSLRKKIRKYFAENKSEEIKPKFSSQGSFAVETIIEPIPREVEENGESKTKLYYDIDDGIYFIGKEDDRKSVETYHKWIKDAVDGHTETPPQDKNTCVRVLFADGHNIDLPIYFKEGDVPELAHKSKGFIDSDPQAFQEWFDERVYGKPQLRRLVRYIKAWQDYRLFTRKDKKMPSGFILTILICEEYYANDRDDIAFKETLIKIKARLDREFECYRPTISKDENLLTKFEAHKEYFLECLDNLIDSAKQALAEKNQKKSCEHWQKHFGDRFPCKNAQDKDDDVGESASLAAVASSSRMWAKTSN
ncbi:MAG: cyclic GMP-AMP synthase DncV-like nucleotidyltransferase [Bacteroidota bacterium]